MDCAPQCRRELLTLALSLGILITLAHAWALAQPNRARIARSILHMREVATALLMAAGPRGGAFPTAQDSPLEIYRSLLRDGYLSDPVALSGEGAQPLKQPNPDLLQPEHCGFAYISGLRADTFTGNDHSKLPLLLTRRSGLQIKDLHTKATLSPDSPFLGAGICVATVEGQVTWIPADDHHTLTQAPSPSPMPPNTLLLEP